MRLRLPMMKNRGVNAMMPAAAQAAARLAVS